MTLRPPIGASLPGALVRRAVIGSPASVDAFTSADGSPRGRLFCGGGARVDLFIGWWPEFFSELGVVLARVATRACGYLRGEQVGNQPVFVRGPHGAIAPEEAGPRTFFAAETDRALDESLDEPFESDRD